MEDPKLRFASQHLSKFGWKEGKGLGKKENGMRNAIKLKLKNNKSGLGHDHGSEFTFQWWDHIYNKAANSVKVSSTEDDTILLGKTDVKVTPALISNKKPYRLSLRGQPLLYGTFVPSGTYTLSVGKVKPIDKTNIKQTKESASEDENKFQGGSNNLEKIFMQTGMTGHKAARHGHGLNGKLKRIQKQENDSGYKSVLKAFDCESNKKKKYTEDDSLFHSNTKEYESCDYIKGFSAKNKESLPTCTRKKKKKKKKKDKNLLNC